MRLESSCGVHRTIHLSIRLEGIQRQYLPFVRIELLQHLTKLVHFCKKKDFFSSQKLPNFILLKLDLDNKAVSKYIVN